MSIKHAPLLVALALIFPAIALGARSGTVTPTPAERAGILKAFGDPPAAAPCLKVRLAVSNRKYGTVRFRMRKSCRRWIANGVSIFKRGKHNHWRVAFAGSTWTCPLARIPLPV
ncbi:MAG TPA: hypothetical protein VIX82_11235 [Solirubrobacteraceae bacterium]